MKIYYEEKRIEINNFDVDDTLREETSFLQIKTNNELLLKQVLDDFFSDKLGSLLYLEAEEKLVKNYFTLIITAGGIVKNGDETLFIFRKGKWDFPKGKIDKGETLEDAALREVEEECGIKDLKLISYNTKTYHVYFDNGLPILKETYWYNMTSHQDENLKPQIEEDITELKWVKRENFNEILNNTYPSIKEIISAQS